VLLSILKCIPGTGYILTHTRQIDTVREFYYRQKSDVIKRANDYLKQTSVKKNCINMSMSYLRVPGVHVSFTRADNDQSSVTNSKIPNSGIML